MVSLMLTKRWEQVERVFNDAIELPIDERNSFVKKVCGADNELCLEVISLLETDKLADKIIEESVLPLVTQLINNDVSKLGQFKKALDAEIKRYPQVQTERPSLRNYFAEKWQYQKIFAMGIVALLFLAGGFVFWKINSEQIKLAQYQPIKSIAILPFRNESNNQDNEYLSDGITESIINQLAQLPELSVKARSSVFQYKGKAVNPQTASKELSVEALLLGRVVEYGNNLTITLELVDGITGRQIWSNQYKQAASSLISLQNEILRDVLNKLQTRLSETEKSKLDKIYTENAEAYQLYLKGRFYWNKRTASDLRKSTEYFNQAIALDPKFALAFSGLAESYVLFSGYGAATPEESFSKAKESAIKALEIDETLAEAHAALGYSLFNYDWNFEESEKHMKRALELNPNYAIAHNWYGNANLLAAGRFDEAIEELEKARKLDPLSLINNADLGNSYLFARRTDQAIEQFQKTVEMDESFYYARAYLGRAYMMKGLFNEALLEFQKAQSLSDDSRILMLMACNYVKMGRKDKALLILNRMKDISKRRYVSSYYFAIAYNALDNKNQAFEWLEKAYRDREGRMTLIKVDPLLDGLRSDFRFEELMRRVGLDN
jgi:TolB-like protein/Flp pilus assembly protein TadD